MKKQMVLCGVVLMVLCCGCAQAAFNITDSADGVVLANDHYSIALSYKTGPKLKSIYNKATKTEYLREADKTGLFVCNYNGAEGVGVFDGVKCSLQSHRVIDGKTLELAFVVMDGP